MSLTINKKLDVTPGGIPLHIHLNQYDSDFSIVLSISAWDGVLDIPSTATAKVRGTKADGNGYSKDATIDATAKTVTVSGDAQLTAAAGTNRYEIVMVNSGKELYTANFVVDVEAAALSDKTVVSESAIDEVKRALQAEQWYEKTKETAATVSDISKRVDSAVSDWLNEHPEATTTVQDNSITVDKLASDTIALINGKGRLTEDIKQALLSCFAKVAWIDEHGQDYYDALKNALCLTSISAVFNQADNIIYDTDSLDTLKQYLTVTEYYDDETNSVITAYTLSGTLTAGTSTITVIYGGKTTTFNVTVTANVFGTLLYNLQNVTYDGTNQTNTNYQLWSEDKDFSIFIDIDPSGNTAREQTVFSVNKLTSPWSGLKLATFNNVYSLSVMGNDIVPTRIHTDVPTVTTDNIKFAITHEQGTNVYKLFTLYGNSITPYSMTREFVTNDRPVIIGADTSGSSFARPWYGTLNSFEVYDRAWTTEEVNKKMGR